MATAGASSQGSSTSARPRPASRNIPPQLGVGSLKPSPTNDSVASASTNAGTSSVVWTAHGTRGRRAAGDGAVTAYRLAPSARAASAYSQTRSAATTARTPRAGNAQPHRREHYDHRPEHFRRRQHEQHRRAQGQHHVHGRQRHHDVRHPHHTIVEEASGKSGEAGARPPCPDDERSRARRRAPRPATGARPRRGGPTVPAKHVGAKREPEQIRAINRRRATRRRGTGEAASGARGLRRSGAPANLRGGGYRRTASGVGSNHHPRAR